MDTLQEAQKRFQQELDEKAVELIIDLTWAEWHLKRKVEKLEGKLKNAQQELSSKQAQLKEINSGNLEKINQEVTKSFDKNE